MARTLPSPPQTGERGFRNSFLGHESSLQRLLHVGSPHGSPRGKPLQGQSLSLPHRPTSAHFSAAGWSIRTRFHGRCWRRAVGCSAKINPECPPGSPSECPPGSLSPRLPLKERTSL